MSFFVNDDGVDSGASKERAKIIAESQNTSSATRLEFWTGNSNADIIERMRIVGDGDVQVLTSNLVIATNGKGINFAGPTAQSGGTSQILDAYEEGTWTPVITPEGGSAASITVNTATYTKVGRLVSLVFRLTIDSISGTNSNNAIELTGMPFTINDANSGGANIGYTGLTASMSGTLALQGNTTTKYRIVNLTGLSGSNASDHLTGNSSLRAQFTYHSE